MLQVFYELTPNVFTEMQTVRYQGFQVGTSCNQGNPNTGKIPFDDPGGTLTIKGWRKVRVVETEATPTLLWSGRMGNKTVKRGDSERGSLRTGADRWWDCDAIDQNRLVSSRIIRGTSANRPAETAGERLAWLLSTSFTVLHDEGHVTYPSDQLDPADYTLQTAANVLEDCALPGGYVYFAMQVDTLDATDTPELFFMLPTSSDWASTVSLSDDLADVDNSTVFAPMYDAQIEIIDEQIASGVAEPYAGGDGSAYVYVSDSDIGDEFAFVDRAVTQANVKTAAKATVIADRHLLASSTEAEKITCAVLVPADMANAIRPWHRIAYKSTWMPNFLSYRDCRVLEWSMTQHPWPGSGGGDGYRIDLVLSPVEDYVPPPWTCPLDPEISGTEGKFYAPLGGTTTDADGVIRYSGGNALYFADGHQFFDGPYPAETCHGFGFPDYGTTGGDAAGTGTASVVGFVFAGEGTIDVSMLPYGATNAGWGWTLYYLASSGIQSQSSSGGAVFEAGDSDSVVTGALPGDATSCYRLLQIGIDVNIGGGGTKLVFPGLTWTPD